MNQHLVPSQEEHPHVARPKQAPRKKKRRTVTITLLGLLIVGVLLSPVFTNKLTGWLHPNPAAPQQALDKSGAIPVLVSPARSADVPVYIDGVGAGKAWNSVLIRNQVDGVLLKLLFTEGQDVHKGDPIAKIDPTLYQAQLDQAIAKKAQDAATLANARLDLQRYINLSSTNAVTKQQVDTQRATVAQQEALVQYDTAAIESARATLTYTDVISPIDGRTGIRVVDEGNLLHAADTSGIVTVTQLRPIAVLFTVPQQQLARINRAAALGSLSVEALDSEGKQIIDHGTLEVVDNTIDQNTGTVRLKANFPNSQLQIWPSAFVNVRLLIETLKQAIVIPVAALQRGPKGTFVYVVSNNEAKVRNVTTSFQDDARAVITAGLKAGEVVVTTGFPRLTDAAKVNAANDEESPAPTDAPDLHQTAK